MAKRKEADLAGTANPVPDPPLCRYRVTLKHVQPDERTDVVEAANPEVAVLAWFAARGIRGSKHKPEVRLEG